MSISLTNEDKNSISLTYEGRIFNPTWEESTMTWDEATETWESQSTVWTKESKNNISLSFESKL